MGKKTEGAGDVLRLIRRLLSVTDTRMANTQSQTLIYTRAVSVNHVQTKGQRHQCHRYSQSRSSTDGHIGTLNIFKEEKNLYPQL